jgi:hypothetical protein
VDRYKQLLLKQRDIMIALTARLNERDETIIQLQEELDAYERIHRETESLAEARGTRIARLEQALRRHGIELPYEEDEGDEGGYESRNFANAGGSNGPNPNNNNGGPGSEQPRKYPPQEQYHLDPAEDEGDEALPLQLLTADEKVEELSNILAHRDTELHALRQQLHDHQNTTRPEMIMRERID